MESLAETLDGLGTAVFRWALLAFVVLNAAAVAAVLITKDRQLVNRWTSRFLAANLFLVGAGGGIPMVASALKLVVKAVAAGQQTEIKLKGK